MLLRRHKKQVVTKLEDVTPKPTKKETPKATTKKRTTKG